jgi:hypothetical protein
VQLSLAQANIDAAVKLRETGNSASAEKMLEAVIVELGNPPPEDPEPERQVLFARAYEALAECQADAGATAPALMALRAAAGMWRDLAATAPQQYHPHLIRSLRRLSYHYKQEGEVYGVVSSLQELVVVFGRMAEADAIRYGHNWLQSIEDLLLIGGSYIDREPRVAVMGELLSASEKLVREAPGYFAEDRIRILKAIAKQVEYTTVQFDRKALLREAGSLRRRLMVAKIASAIRLR